MKTNETVLQSEKNSEKFIYNLEKENLLKNIIVVDQIENVKTDGRH